MSIIDEKYLKPFSNYNKLPQLHKPEPNRNGKIEKIDGKTRFQFCPSDHPDFCPNLGNSKYDIEEMLYTVNKHNFRSDEFDSDTGLLTIGCSYTYGIGLRDNEVYSRKLANMLNIPLWNLGVGGIGPEACLLLTKQFLLAGKTPKAMVIQWPAINRKLLVEKIYAQMDDNILNWINDDAQTDVEKIKNTRTFHSWSANDPYPKEEYFQRTAKGHLLSNASWSYDFYLIREQMIMLAKLNNIPVVEITPAFYPEGDTSSIFRNCVHKIRYLTSPWSTPVKNSGARDNLHHGEDTHNLIAEQLYDLLDKEL